MDASKLIITLIKDQQIKQGLNPLVYYGLKLMYDSNFANRCKYFGSAIKRLYDELGNNLNLQIATLDNNLMNAENTMTFDMSIVDDVSDKKDNIINKDDEDPLNISANKDTYNSVNKLMKKNWKWCFEKMVDYDDDYILDREDNYILLRLIKDYIFSDTPPHESTLMICYNIFASSIEMLFCLKLILSFPNYYFMKKEKAQIDEYFVDIKKRIELFYDEWCGLYWDKYQNNKLIKEIIGPKEKRPEIKKKIEEKQITKINLSEPILNNKYISFTKLIKDGPFCFDVEEIARQICLIDQEMFCSLKYEDYLRFMTKKEIPRAFEKFFIREKQLQSYILVFMTMHSNLENKKNMIQNFISLAQTLKFMNNQQTLSTIINTFNVVGITKKKLLWKLIEKKYRDIYNILVKEVDDMELYDNTILKDNKEEGSVPHIRYIIALINNLVIQLKALKEEKKMIVCKEFKELIHNVEENSKKKYMFFKVNPLYDFFKFGFLEIFKPKKWGLKSWFDFSAYTSKLVKLDQLLSYLVKNFQNADI